MAVDRTTFQQWMDELWMAPSGSVQVCDPTEETPRCKSALKAARRAATAADARRFAATSLLFLQGKRRYRFIIHYSSFIIHYSLFTKKHASTRLDRIYYRIKLVCLFFLHVFIYFVFDSISMLHVILSEEGVVLIDFT